MVPSAYAALRRSFGSAASAAQPQSQYWLLRYQYVPNMLERRGPVRPSHLQHANAATARGELLLGGAHPPEVAHATLAFKASKDTVEQFARNDPYVTSGLVTHWDVQEWAVVVGSAL